MKQHPTDGREGFLPATYQQSNDNIRQEHVKGQFCYKFKDHTTLKRTEQFSGYEFRFSFILFNKFYE
jgi:hypothetical protein